MIPIELRLIMVQRGYSTRPSAFPIIKSISKSEYERGYLYVSVSNALTSHIKIKKFDIDFLGTHLSSKTISNGRVIIGRAAMRECAKPQMLIRIESVSNDILAVHAVTY